MWALDGSHLSGGGLTHAGRPGENQGIAKDVPGHVVPEFRH